LKTIKNSLFTADFSGIQYLDFYENQIETIENSAFQHLTQLKWIRLHSNKIRALPHQIFKNNPEMTWISLHSNKINSITPEFFKNLSKLQFVQFAGGNQCINKHFGCESGSCSVVQSQMESDLATCYNNHLYVRECASKSGNLDNLSPEKIEKILDLIISSGPAAALGQKNCIDYLAEKGYQNLLIKKALNLNMATDSELTTLDEGFEKFHNETLESDANLLQAISKNSGDIKSAGIQRDSELDLVKKEIADLKSKLEETTVHIANLKTEWTELLQKKFDDFLDKLNNGA
jgi:Leucine-rich repeat (LRR) protein